MAFVQAESTLSHKRKSSLGNSFQAKRARLNKITGKLSFFFFFKLKLTLLFIMSNCLSLYIGAIVKVLLFVSLCYWKLQCTSQFEVCVLT